MVAEDRNESSSSESSSSESSSSESSSSEYKYQRLSDESSIRILELFPGSRGSPLECKIIERPLKSCGRYEALSYAWGDDKKVEKVWCDTKYIGITRNCSIALHRLRKSKRSRHLWVDSICIDQKVFEERNHQVSLMNKVYSKAQCVIVWLGKSKKKKSVQNKTALDFIRQLSKQNEVSQATYQSKLSALNVLFRNSWFSRTWPVQEVAFSRKCKIISGKYSISARQLMHFLKIAERHTVLSPTIDRVHVHRKMWA
ncbi:HET-domain-containing protein [Karstenula rhodostoma CBS 690.94]|uniref:HET-domain-containing protein n=1 Tax=Karstenula rhodostoma CBS 690.94 TaxID=1392251 RepID=A0A9P4U5N7_9PLEO|nr:HET-domain-containing protein [Karstenula rhodostoma CBS 690.94]